MCNTEAQTLTGAPTQDETEHICWPEKEIRQFYMNHHMLDNRLALYASMKGNTKYENIKPQKQCPWRINTWSSYITVIDVLQNYNIDDNCNNCDHHFYFSD